MSTPTTFNPHHVPKAGWDWATLNNHCRYKYKQHGFLPGNTSRVSSLDQMGRMDGKPSQTVYIILDVLQRPFLLVFTPTTEREGVLLFYRSKFG